MLATFDDFLTTLLIETLHFWTPIHKVDASRRAPRAPRKQTTTIHSLLKNHAAGQQELLEKFLEIPVVRAFFAPLRHKPKEQQEFERHSKRYLAIYAPDTGFELGTTERYRHASGRSELCVLARRTFEAGEQITHLTGRMAELTEDDEASFTNTQAKDFSIIYSERLDASCLMLGPCRFVNHDCQPNARFIPSGLLGVGIVATRQILRDEEITVSYAENYFGKNNAECLCSTCELEKRGAF
ncbi:hypothetical protein V1511DRAFT_463423, partial [Dipodascopsis uninucleata]